MQHTTYNIQILCRITQKFSNAGAIAKLDNIL